MKVDVNQDHVQLVLDDHEMSDDSAQDIFKTYILPRMFEILEQIDETQKESLQEENVLSLIEDILIEENIIKEDKLFFQVDEDEDDEIEWGDSSHDDDDIDYDDENEADDDWDDDWDDDDEDEYDEDGDMEDMS